MKYLRGFDDINEDRVERKSKGYWLKEKCAEEALKYNHRSEFQKKSISAYVISRKNGWLDDICSHMVRPKNNKL